MVALTFRFAPAVLLVGGICAALLPAQDKPITDLAGDPLPDGAILRLGTTRWRPGGAGAALAYAPDGKLVVSGGWHGTLRFWDVATGREVRRMPVRERAVKVIAFSPDGTKLAVAGSEGRVCLHDVASGKELRGHHWSTGPLYALAFSPDGKLLASAGKTGVISLLAIASGKAALALQGHDKEITGLAFSPDSKALASASADQTVRLWTLDTGRELFRIRADQVEYHSVAFAPDGALLAAGGPSGDDSDSPGQIQLWDISSLRDRLRKPKPDAHEIKQMIAELDGKTFTARQKAALTLQGLGDIAEPALQQALAAKPPLEMHQRIEELLKKLTEGPPPPGRVLHTLPCGDDSVDVIAFTRDGQVLAAGDRQGIRFWQTRTGKELPRLACPQGAVGSLAFSPDGRSLAYTAGSALISLAVPAAGDLRWEPLRTEQQPGHQAEVIGVAFAPDGRTVASIGAGEAVIRVWDAITGRPLHTLAAPGVAFSSVAFTADGKLLAGGGDKDQGVLIRVWDTAKFSEARTITAPPATWTFGVQFAPDGKTAAAVQMTEDAADSVIHRWDIMTGKPLGQPLTWCALRAAPAIFADGRSLAGGDQRRVVRVQNTAEDRETYQFAGFTGEVVKLAVSPHGKYLAAVTDREQRGTSDVRVWDLATGKEALKLDLELGQAVALAFSADDKRLAIGGRDSAIRLVETASGRPLRVLKGPSPVGCLAFGPDGRLASGGADTAVLIWQLNADK